MRGVDPYKDKIISLRCPYCGGPVKKGRFYEATNRKYAPYQCQGECRHLIWYGEIYGGLNRKGLIDEKM